MLFLLFMQTPKKIHLCWFSGQSYPVEIKICIDSWKRVLPDYTIRLWTYADAKDIDIPYLKEALIKQKWAFASDVVRFYAIYTEGGVYMDSDIFVRRRFEEIMPEHGFVTFNEKNRPDKEIFGLQAAFLVGVKGNCFCADMLDYYRTHSFIKEDGSLDETISPMIMRQVALKYGYRNVDKEQHLGEISIYPTYLVSPGKSYQHHKNRIAEHRLYGSWRKRKWSRKIDIFIHHVIVLIRYKLCKC